MYMENRREWRGGAGEEEGELQRTRNKGDERNKKVTGNETGTRAVVLVRQQCQRNDIEAEEMDAEKRYAESFKKCGLCTKT